MRNKKVRFGLPLAIVGFVVTNVFANVVAGPARAVVADLSPAGRLQVMLLCKQNLGLFFANKISVKFHLRIFSFFGEC